MIPALIIISSVVLVAALAAFINWRLMEENKK